MSRRVAISLIGAVTCFAALNSWQALARFTTFHNRTYDLAMYTRLAWGIVHGDLWDPIVGGNLATAHMSLWLAPLGLVGAVFGTAPALLILQSLAVAAAAWPLCRIGARRLGSLGACAALLGWFLYPNLVHVCTYEFHPGTLATLPMAWAFDAVDRRAPRALIVSSLFVIACRADFALLVALLGIVAIWRWRSSTRSVVVLVSLSTAYWLINTLLLQHFYAPQPSSLELHFGKWSSDVSSVFTVWLLEPQRVVEHLFEGDRWMYPLRVLAPLALLPLLGWRTLLVAAPVVAFNLLSAFPTTLHFYSHYLTPAVVVLVVAALEGLAVLAERTRLLGTACIVLPIALLISHVRWGGSPVSSDYNPAEFTTDARSEAAAAALDIIPSAESVQAPDFLLPHLAERRIVHRAPPPERQTDWVVLDVSHRQRYTGLATLLRTIEEPNVRSWLRRTDHSVAFASTELIVLRRGGNFPGPVLSRYFLPPAPPRAAVPISACLSIEAAALQHAELALTLLVRKRCSADLAIRFGSGARPDRVDLLFDGLLSPARLQAGDRVRSTHVLSTEETAQIIRDGLQVGALRSSGAPPAPTDPIAVEIALSTD